MSRNVSFKVFTASKSGKLGPYYSESGQGDLPQNNLEFGKSMRMPKTVRESGDKVDRGFSSWGLPIGRYGETKDTLENRKSLENQIRRFANREGARGELFPSVIEGSDSPDEEERYQKILERIHGAMDKHKTQSMAALVREGLVPEGLEVEPGQSYHFREAGSKDPYLDMQRDLSFDLKGHDVHDIQQREITPLFDFTRDGKVKNRHGGAEDFTLGADDTPLNAEDIAIKLLKAQGVDPEGIPTDDVEAQYEYDDMKHKKIEEVVKLIGSLSLLSDERAEGDRLKEVFKALREGGLSPGELNYLHKSVGKKDTETLVDNAIMEAAKRRQAEKLVSHYGPVIRSDKNIKETVDK